MNNKPKGIDVVVVGGVAKGQLLRGVDPTAQFFELRRPDYIKPITYSKQLDPEVMHESDTYELHVMELRNSDNPTPSLMGIGVITGDEGQSLTWAMKEMIVAYVEKVTAEHIQAGRIQTQ